MKTTPLAAVLRDQELLTELQSSKKVARGTYAATELARPAARGAFERDFAAKVQELAAAVETESLESLESRLAGDYATEAIIVEFGRPALFIREGTFEAPASDVWSGRLDPHRAALNRAICAAGRVELLHHPSYQWVGTGWLVDDRLLVTNRHVALIFAERRGEDFAFSRNPAGREIAAQIDFLEEYQSASRLEIEVLRVRYIAPLDSSAPDIAVLEVRPHDELPEPIAVAAASEPTGDYVAVIGYPAYDPRNPDDVMARVFGGVYDVKRLSPGLIVTGGDAVAPFVLEHDCSTLGGNSGSMLVDVASGDVLGLHFGGRYRVGNYAVRAETVKLTLDRASAGRAAPPLGAGPAEAPKLPVSSYAGREGYNPKFLGDAKALTVPLPALGERWSDDVVYLNGSHSDYVLRYTHFSIAMCQSRRLCFYTAVNIDGKRLHNIIRGDDAWRLDSRIPDKYQIDNVLYKSNKLDRGHQVRRLDPVWGARREAELANDDTFHYTNSCPQHARLNQKVWNDLEDYLLGAAADYDLKVSVFTGPVLGDDDPPYRGIRIPVEYWKVAVMKGPGGKLHATGYLLSQDSFMDDLEFVFGQFRTYQVPIARIETRTGLLFGKLKNFDPLAGQESQAAGGAHALESVYDIRL